MRVHLAEAHPGLSSSEAFRVNATSKHQFPLHRKIMESVNIMNSAVPLLNSKVERAGCRIPAIQIEGKETKVCQEKPKKNDQDNPEEKEKVMTLEQTHRMKAKTSGIKEIQKTEEHTKRKNDRSEKKIEVTEEPKRKRIREKSRKKNSDWIIRAQEYEKENPKELTDRGRKRKRKRIIFKRPFLRAQDVRSLPGAEPSLPPDQADVTGRSDHKSEPLPQPPPLEREEQDYNSCLALPSHW